MQTPRQQTPQAAPPTRDGISPSRVFLPAGSWTSYEDFLAARFPAVSRTDWQSRIRQGKVLDASGRRIQPGQSYAHGNLLYYYRSLPAETLVPFTETVIYQDEWIVVADKPHFLPVIPSGRYLQETLLVRLKRRLNINTLSPIHRIDRETAGLVVFSVQPATRSRYQVLFHGRQVEKHYEAIAPHRPDIPLPSLYRSCLVQSGESFMQMKEVPGKPNAETTIRLLESKNALARYALQPLTGKKHQLRVQMMGMGLPILNDRIYPELQPEEADEKSRNDAFASPLQLLAKAIAFTDPVTGAQRYFESTQQLRL
ncbi:MAG: pseudouridine synthase [Oxalobacter sp.]|nr:pseudouridine synthase [Oxalobacter sp.]